MHAVHERRTLHSRLDESGSRGALLLPGPLRTVQAPLDAHGSSKPRPQPGARRLRDGGTDNLCVAAMNLLMAIQVRQFKIGVAVRASACLRLDVVFVEFLPVEESLPAH